MHRFRVDEGGVSEVIGALILILIVFAAASSLAIFVEAKQKEFQEQERFEQRRLLERFEVLDIDPVLNETTGNTWKEIDFTVASLHINPSYLSGLVVAGEPLENWTLRRLNVTSGNIEAFVYENPRELRIEPRERFVVHVNLTTHGFLPISIGLNDEVELEVTTWNGNLFSRAFLPPAAIAFVETESVWNGTAYEPILVLDAARSEALGDASLVSWAWDVQPDDLQLKGRKVRASLSELSADHTITLTVADNFGMMDSTEIRYFY